MDQKSDKLSIDDVQVVKLLLVLGFQHKRIASLFDVNQGRVSEINSGLKHKNVFPYGMANNVDYPIKSKGEDREMTNEHGLQDVFEKENDITVAINVMERTWPGYSNVKELIKKKLEQKNSGSFYAGDKPDGKFVALYMDGSGCALFMRIDGPSGTDMYMDASDEYNIVKYDWFCEHGFSIWLRVPDEYKFWCERE